MAAGWLCSGFFLFKMHVFLVSVVLVFCINLQLVVSQCTGCECEVSQENLTEVVKNETPLEDSDELFLPSWMDIEKLDVERIANGLVDWVQNAWNSGVKLKLNILKNEQNDTLVNVHFKDVDPVTDNNEGKLNYLFILWFFKFLI